jgi:hypothetical protein
VRPPGARAHCLRCASGLSGCPGLGDLGDHDALHQQAQSALRASPGARAYYDEQCDRGLDHDAALRALSNWLIGILHGCLKTGILYDEATVWSHRVRIPGTRAANLRSPQTESLNRFDVAGLSDLIN